MLDAPRVGRYKTGRFFVLFRLLFVHLSPLLAHIEEHVGPPTQVKFPFTWYASSRAGCCRTDTRRALIVFSAQDVFVFCDTDPPVVVSSTQQRYRTTYWSLFWLFSSC